MQWIQILILLGLVLLWIPTHGRKLYGRWQAFKAWEAAQQPVADASPDAEAASILQAGAAAPIDTTLLPGAGRALAKPPADLRIALREMVVKGESDPYSFPIGWRLTTEGKPSLVHAALVNDVNHILLTGFTDCGKDSWAASMLLSLGLLNTPQQMQFAILDGKGGLSWIGWAKKQHVWLLAETDSDIEPAMAALKAERERRQRLLKKAECEKWDEYEQGDMPLLVVFVSELMLLQDATSKTELADWLNTELTSARAAGIRYIVSAQTVTRMDTRWRSQIGLYIAGYQPRDDADEPNTSFSTKDILRFGTLADGTTIAVPPSALPVPPAGQGVFTCIQGRTVVTVRSSYVNKPHRQWLMSQLPDKPQPAAVRAPIAAPVAADAGPPSSVLAPPAGEQGSMAMAAAMDDNPMLAALLAATPAPATAAAAKPSADAMQPVVARAAVQEIPLGYDPDELARVLTTTLQKDLPHNDTFVAACRAAYKRHRTYTGVIREFWGVYNGDRNEVVKRALNGPPQSLTSFAAAA